MKRLAQNLLIAIAMRAKLAWLFFRAVGLLALVIVAGCASRPGAPVPALPELTTGERDALFYHWPEATPKVALRASELVQAVPVKTLIWFQPGTCFGWQIEESTNLPNWHILQMKYCEYIFKNRAVTSTVPAPHPAAFYRVSAFNH